MEKQKDMKQLGGEAVSGYWAQKMADSVERLHQLIAATQFQCRKLEESIEAQKNAGSETATLEAELAAKRTFLSDAEPEYSKALESFERARKLRKEAFGSKESHQE